MAKGRPLGGVSSLLLDELFSSEADAFVPTLLTSNDPKQLAQYAERLKSDPRPWSRHQCARVADEVRRGLRPAGQARRPAGDERPARPVWLDRVLIKRLFKHAEARGDLAAVGAFATLFDAMVRRRLTTRYHYDWRSRTAWEDDALVMRKSVNAFSRPTRLYLRRRAWRYFRRLGHQRPAEYCAAVAGMLARYEDPELATGIDILDSWALVHACFGKHDALDLRGPAHVRVKPGRDLAELTPAPYYLPLWQATEAATVLLGLVERAAARVVRVWAIDLLRRQHGRRLPGLTVARVVRLLDHADEEVQQFGAELLGAMPGLDTLSLDLWLALLGTRNLTALETVAQLVRRYVPAERMSLETAMGLATARPAPVARLGLDYLRQKPITTAADARLLPRAAAARSSAVAGELAAWALGVVERFYDVDAAVTFFDSLERPARDAAWAWLTPSSRGWGDPALYARLLETPFDDVRLRLIEALRDRAGLPGQSAGALGHLWASVLLNVHRGGRHKLIALRQISEAIEADPADAERLLPVLAVALRSVRPPEARAGLAALVRLMARRPDMEVLVARHLPEVRLVGEVEACR